MSLSQIFEGWKNHLTPNEYLSGEIDKAHTERMAICRGCPHNSLNNPEHNPLRWDEHCTECGCTLVAKTKCLSCSCPLDKWAAIITSEEEDKIEKNERES